MGYMPVISTLGRPRQEDDVQSGIHNKTPSQNPNQVKQF